MALGGVSIDWDETSPPGSESAGLGDDRIRELKTSARSALNSEHVFPSTSSVAGAHRAGSARAFYGAQSLVSSSDTDGRLMIASDTSKLFGAGSAGTVQLGAGPLGLSLGSYAPITFPQRLGLAVEIGATLANSSGQYKATFPSAFSTAPFVFVSSSASSVTGAVNGWVPNITAISASDFSGFIHYLNESVASATTVNWIAVGHRAL